MWLNWTKLFFWFFGETSICVNDGKYILKYSYITLLSGIYPETHKSGNAEPVGDRPPHATSSSSSFPTT